MAPQVGLEPTTLRLTAVRVKTLSAVSSVAYGEHIRISRPQLGYMGYAPARGGSGRTTVRKTPPPLECSTRATE
jgi:hypothetical protein